MKDSYLKVIRRKLFFKYISILIGLCLCGFGVQYFFDNVLDGFVIGFLALIVNDPYAKFASLYNIALPLAIILTCVILVFILCRDLSFYMRILVNGIEDVMQKERTKIKLPAELKKSEELLIQIARDYQTYQKAALADEGKKRDLVYLLAQDIKIPLSNILLYLEFLEKEKRISPEIKKEYIVNILNKSLSLEDMINEFFDLTRFNLQYAKWNPEHMYLDLLMEQVVDEYYQMMEDKHIGVVLHKGSQLALFADNQKIARSIRDLLRNMIELSNEHSTIEIEVKQLDTYYEIMISGSVPHLSAYQVAHLFHNYYRLEDVHIQKKAHVLGLGVAKQIMDMHKGNLRASSIGNILYFYLDVPKRNEDFETDKIVV